MNFLSLLIFKAFLFYSTNAVEYSSNYSYYSTGYTEDDRTATTEAIITTTTETPSMECPEGWLYGGQLGCFHFNTDMNKMGLSWIDAQIECEIQDGYLAEAKTQEVHIFLKSATTVLEEFTGKMQWWIGLTDMGHETR